MTEVITLKGTTFTVTGTFSGTTKNAMWAQIEAGGGKYFKSLANKTEVLVVGREDYAVRDKVKKALMRGIHVLTQAEFEQLVAEGSLAIVSEQPDKEGDVDIDESVAVFRSMLEERMPTRAKWKEIIAQLDQTHSDAIPVVVDYINSHIEPYLDDMSPLWFSLGRRFGAQRLEPTDEWLQQILASKDHQKFEVLRWINLYDEKLTGKTSKGLLECTHLHNVRMLDLAWNKLPMGFYKNLAQAEHFKGLQHLRLENNAFNAKAAAGLASTHGFPHMRSLDLGRCNLEKGGICEALFGNGAFPALETLKLERTELQSEELFALAGASHLTQLKTLEIGFWNRLTIESLAALLEAEHFSGLRQLNVSLLRGLPSGVGELVARCHHLSQLEVLYLNGLSLSSDDLNALAGAAHLASLQQLKFSVTSPEELDAAAAFLKSEHLANLTLLEIESEKESEALLTAIVESPHLTKLKYLSVGAQLSAACLEAVANHPHFASLEVLFVNSFSRGGIDVVNKSPYLSDDVKQQLIRIAG